MVLFLSKIIKVWLFLKITLLRLRLDRSFVESGVYTVLKQMNPHKALGPDGMNAQFYQKNLEVVGLEVTKSILGVLNDEAQFLDCNETNIALVPKKKHQQVPTDYRPISLCNILTS